MRKQKWLKISKNGFKYLIQINDFSKGYDGPTKERNKPVAIKMCIIRKFLMNELGRMLNPWGGLVQGIFTVPLGIAG